VYCRNRDRGLCTFHHGFVFELVALRELFRNIAIQPALTFEPAASSARAGRATPDEKLEETTMKTLMKPALVIGVAGAMALGAMTSSEAGGRHWGAGAGLAAGAIAGAAIVGAAASNAYYGGPYGYGYDGYGYAPGYAYAPGYSYAADYGYAPGYAYRYGGPAYGYGYDSYAYAPGYRSYGYGAPAYGYDSYAYAPGYRSYGSSGRRGNHVRSGPGSLEFQNGSGWNNGRLDRRQYGQPDHW
jgi:hypothetical protein